MKELVFKVELKSDIVLPATSNTEGKIDYLDFIAGSNFLGMVAKNYDKFQNSFDVFHSGKVRFTDAHILKDGKVTYKMPLSIFKEKTDENKVINQLRTSLDKLKQAQQVRNGYITEDLEHVFIDYAYSQKSAYDKTKRTSKEGQMYGYKAIKKGSTWQFVVKIDGISSEDEELIIKTLEDSKRLGKSKSAEYGQVEINHIKSQTIPLQTPKVHDKTVLYCNSRLALVDECGNPTLDLKYLCEGIEIDDEQTQIRTSSFTPYNRAMQTKSYERVCINKGSVIVLKNATDKQLETIQRGVGAFLSEGFGEILINPSFLDNKDFKLKKENEDKLKSNQREKLDIKTSDKVVLFLQNRHNQKIEMLDIANEVAEFVKKHKKQTFANIKSSQWGNIRSICTSSDNYQDEIIAYISNGTKKWETDQIKKLKQNMTSREFTKLLAMKMGGKND